MNQVQNKAKAPKKFLGVYFSNCHVYGRLYRNKENTFYIGQCPRCGSAFKVRIGENGTSNRFFNAYCQ